MVTGNPSAVGVNATHAEVYAEDIDLEKRYAGLRQDAERGNYLAKVDYELRVTAMRDLLQERALRAVDYVLRNSLSERKYWTRRQIGYVALETRQEDYTLELCSSIHWTEYCVSFSFADVVNGDLYVPTVHELRVRAKRAFAELEKKLTEADKQYQQAEQERLSQHE